MAGGAPMSSASGSNLGENKNYMIPLTMIMSLFFMWGLITVFNDILSPHLKEVFGLEQWQATLVTFCFFISYGVMSIPAGIIIDRFGYKRSMVGALIVVGLGLLLFIPASMVVSFPFFLFALFVVGCGITTLQVAANPYVILLGKPETAGSRLNLAGGFNSMATFIGPSIGAATIFVDESWSPEQKAESVQIPYLVISGIAILVAVVLWRSTLPKVRGEGDTGGSLGGALKYRHNVLGSLAIFFYVGAEVAIGVLLIDYLKTPEMGNQDPKLAGYFLTYYWGGAMVGRFIGFIVLQKIKENVGLAFVTIVTIILVTLSMFDFSLNTWMDISVVDVKTWSFTGMRLPLAAVLLALVGLFNSIMWPTIFPLGIKDMGKDTTAGASLMVTMVIGGAFIPLLQGVLVDVESVGFQYNFIVCVVCYAYILFFALKGHKVVNKTPDQNIGDPAPTPEEVEAAQDTV